VFNNNGVLKFSGYLLLDGGKPVTECGVKYGLQSDNLNNSLQSELINNTFNVDLSQLEDGIYYYKAYAINSEGEGSGNIMSFERRKYLIKLKLISKNKSTFSNENEVIFFKTL